MGGGGHTGTLWARMKVYTKDGDDGTTGLFYGGRVAKDSELPTAYGSVDEAQAALGMVRAACDDESELGRLVVSIMRDLYVLMAELATAPENAHKLAAGATLTTAEMVDALETHIDAFTERFEMPTEFVVPGQTEIAARLDVARTVVRRAERDVLPAVRERDSEALRYLNRLSDLLWTLARWQEGEPLITKEL